MCTVTNYWTTNYIQFPDVITMDNINRHGLINTVLKIIKISNLPNPFLHPLKIIWYWYTCTCTRRASYSPIPRRGGNVQLFSGTRQVWCQKICDRLKADLEYTRKWRIWNKLCWWGLMYCCFEVLVFVVRISDKYYVNWLQCVRLITCRSTRLLLIVIFSRNCLY